MSSGFAVKVGKFLGTVVSWLEDEETEMNEISSLRMTIEQIQVEVRELAGTLQQAPLGGVMELVIWVCSCGNTIEAYAGHSSSAGRKLLRCAMCSRPMRPEHII